MTDERSNRFNVQLDEEHAAKLHAVAERVYVQPGTLARSLLSMVLDQMEADATSITDILDAIPGAWDRAQEGLAAARTGRFVPLDEL